VLAAEDAEQLVGEAVADAADAAEVDRGMPEVLQPGCHAPCVGARRQCALLADQAQRNAGVGAGEGVNRIDLFAVLQVVHRAITHCLLDQAGPKADEADSGAAMLIQPSWWLNGSAANLNIHLHCLVLDSVYRYDTEGAPVFVEVPVPTDEALQAVLHKIITRLMKLLTRKGCLGKVGQTTRADGDSDSDSDSDEARVRRLLQAAAWPCRPRRASGPGTNSPLDCLSPGQAAEAGFSCGTT